MSTFTTPLVGKFLTELDTRYLNGRDWRLLAEFDFASEVLQRIVRVPAGFVTDFASIPRLFWPIFSPTGPYGKAAVIHDDCYQNPEMIDPPVSRLLADRTLREGMIALDVPWVTRCILYGAVRACGWWAFTKDRAK